MILVPRKFPGEKEFLLIEFESLLNQQQWCMKICEYLCFGINVIKDLCSIPLTTNKNYFITFLIKLNLYVSRFLLQFFICVFYFVSFISLWGNNKSFYFIDSICWNLINNWTVKGFSITNNRKCISWYYVFSGKNNCIFIQSSICLSNLFQIIYNLGCFRLKSNCVSIFYKGSNYKYFLLLLFYWKPNAKFQSDIMCIKLYLWFIDTYSQWIKPKQFLVAIEIYTLFKDSPSWFPSSI